MLHGLYLWTFEGYQNFGGNPVPKDSVQGIQFNGNETFSIAFGKVNIGGFILIDGGGAVGTYTVNADCTGSMQVTDGPSFYVYVGSDGKQLTIMQTGGGPGDGSGLALGTATRLP
jgi:hypothetical protein